MKKILLIGIGEETSPKQPVVTALKRTGLTYLYAKWSDLSFCGKTVCLKNVELDLKKIGSVFFDIFRFPITKKISRKEFQFNLENEFNVFLNLLEEKKIYTPNSQFFLQNPFYNKFSQMHLFASKKIPTIPTVHLCDNTPEKVSAALGKQGFSFPLVAKESYGGGGNKVWKLSTKKELDAFVENRRNTNILFQPYMKNEADYRAIVIGGKCLGLMKRSAQKGEWKNNFSLGGKVEKHTDAKMSAFAVCVCKKLGLESAGLDILSTKTGFIIIEINLFFGIEGFQSIYPEIAVAEKIIHLIKSKTI